MDFRAPTFSWSNSRGRAFSECQRFYAHRYYTSWGGWERGAPEEARMAYRLKNLDTYEMVLGSAIHDRAAEIARALRDGKEVPSHAEAMSKTRRALNELWRGSKDPRGFERAPKHHPMLFESYYGRNVSDRRIQKVRDTMERCLANLYGWAGWDRVGASPRESIHLMSPTEDVLVGQIPVYAAPDLVFRKDEVSPWEIVDWKTGSTEGAEEQLALYGLYLSEHAEFDFGDCGIGRVVALGADREWTIELNPGAIEAARRRMESSVAEMKNLLVGLDTSSNEPVPLDQFRLAYDTSKCEWCPFLAICESDLKEPGGPY